MSNVIVQYSIKSEHVAENARLIEAVYEELNSVRPNGIQYAAFLLEDGVSFVHVGQFEDEAAEQALPNMPAFREFQRDIANRFAVQPNFAHGRKIGSYHSIAAQPAGSIS